MRSGSRRSPRASIVCSSRTNRCRSGSAATPSFRICQLMAKGSSCTSQRQVYAETGDYRRQVVGSVVDELRQSVPK